MSDSSDYQPNEPQNNVERGSDVVLAESIMAGTRNLSTRNASDRKI